MAKMKPFKFSLILAGILVCSISLQARALPPEHEEHLQAKWAQSIQDLQVAQNQANESEAIRRYIAKYHPQVSSVDAQQISEEIVIQSKEQQLDPKWVAAIIDAESGFNKRAANRSGAKGLGQLMASTYRQFKIQNPYDIKENLTATVQYLKGLVSMWDGHSLQLSFALAAYLRGEIAVKRAKGDFSNFTVSYVDAVFKRYQKVCQIRNDLANPSAVQ